MPRQALKLGKSGNGQSKTVVDNAGLDAAANVSWQLCGVQVLWTG